MHEQLAAKIAPFLELAANHPNPEQFYPVVFSPSSARIRMQNLTMAEPEEFINFSTSNYLGIGQRPEVLDAVRQGVDRYGLGANGSPVLSGYFETHRALERELAAFHDKADAVLFSSGVAANIGAVAALVGAKDAVALDELAHGSLFMGAKTSGAQVRFYRHRDMDELDWLLGRLAKTAECTLLVVPGVFSMTGEIEDLPAVVDMARKHKAVLFLDDAHALGVLGPRGLGTAEHFGLSNDCVDIHMGTLSKSLSGVGGYIAAPAEVVQFLRYNAKTHMLSAAIPPAVAAGCLAAARILSREGGALSAELRRKANLFRKSLCDGGVNAQGQDTAIVPVFLDDEEKIWPVNRMTLSRNVFANPVVYPGVPKGQGRLRFTVTLTHEDDDLKRAAEIVCECIHAADAA